MPLTDRQAQILRAVVLEYNASRRPVGSRTLVEQGVAASPSTVRYELGRLEELGLLEHPHTSAGRVPTDSGYRLYVDQLMHDDVALVQYKPLVLNDASRRVDDALRDTTQAIAEATRLLAVITAPPASGAVIRHIEVLQLQPHVLVVVCITSTGDVSRHVVNLDGPADSGIVDWAAAYLNEQVTGMTLGQNLLRQRLQNPELSPSERVMLGLLAPAFTDLVDRPHDVHVAGTPALINELGSDVQQIMDLMHVLDERRRLLDSLRRSIGARKAVVRIGGENDLPELQPLSMVAASYGLATRPLGMVSLIGPRAMDYPRAVVAVHAAAETLSAVVEELYDH